MSFLVNFYINKIINNEKIKLFDIILAIIVALTVIMGQGLTHYVTAQQQKLTMVTSADYPPYEFRDTATGKDEIIGFDIDIAKNIAQELGYQLETKDTDFNRIIPALQSGRADFAMAGMTPTAERKKNVAFSDIYYEAKNTIVAIKGSNLTKPEDLAGKNVGVQLGSTQEEAAKKFKNVKLKSLNRTAEIIQEVKAGRSVRIYLKFQLQGKFMSMERTLLHIKPIL